MDGPCPPAFGPFVVSSGFYHRIAFALPFGLACTHAGVWQCRPAVTLSGRLTSGARSRASAVPSFSGPLHQPGAGTPAGTDEMFDVLHLLSHGASRRTINYYGRFYKSMLYPVFRHLNEILVRWAMRKYKRLRRHQTGHAGSSLTSPDASPVCSRTGGLACALTAGRWEPGESRGSRRDLRAPGGEIPPGHSPRGWL